MVRRILITGASGFAGCHLAEALPGKPDTELLGVSRHGIWPAGGSHLTGLVPLRSCELERPEGIRDLLNDWRPHAIYHLAGYAQVGRSFQEPDAAWRGNLDATRFLLEAAAKCGGSPRILLVGSGLVYGEPEAPDQPCDERAPLRPDSPYAASKAAADLLGYQCWRSSGLDIVRVRPFNHIGPGQSADFAVPHFARQLVEIERGLRPPILETGDLRPHRDLTDVRDIVRGYIRLMEQGRPGEVYNLGSGKVHAMGDVLNRLRELAGVRCELRRRPELLRDSEPAVLRADASKARRDVAWSPEIPLEKTLSDILAHWRQSL